MKILNENRKNMPFVVWMSVITAAVAATAELQHESHLTLWHQRGHPCTGPISRHSSLVRCGQRPQHLKGQREDIHGPSAVTVRCDQRQQHLRGHGEDICGPSAVTVHCGQRPQHLRGHSEDNCGPSSVTVQCGQRPQ